MKALQEQKHSTILPNYAKRFYSAIITFRHHLVFDPRDKVIGHYAFSSALHQLGSCIRSPHRCIHLLPVA